MTPEQPIVFEPRAVEPPKPIHPIFRFLLSVVLIVVANIVVGMLGFLSLKHHPVLADSFYRWGTSAVLIAGFLVFSRLLDRWRGDTWRYIGLPWEKNAISQTLMGLAIGGVLVTLAVAVIGLFGQLTFVSDFSGPALTRQLLIVVLLVGGALLEELMFRGYPFQRLVEVVGKWGAVLVLSAIFGAIHLGNPNAGGVLSWGFFNTIVVGGLFAYAYLRTRTLWLPLGFHFGWNFFLGVVYGLPVSGIRDFSMVVRTTAKGSKLLTGGGYGIEASLTGAIVILLGFVLVAWAPKPSPEILPVESHEPQPSI
jgi:membrane protease YdiL (CAAX protease family)